MRGGLFPLLETASPQAHAIYEVFVVVMAVCGIILALVTAVVVLGMWRFRQRPGRMEDPVPHFGNLRLEIAWTVVPLLIVTGVFILTAWGMRKSDPPGTDNPDLTVIAHQWWWEVRYAKDSLITANEIHIPVGVKLRVRLESSDVIHDFWSPRLARKMDMIPGHPNWIWLEADAPDTYQGFCAEFCGDEHGGMRFSVIAESASAFEAWRQHQIQPAPVLSLTSVTSDTSAIAGEKLFQELTCANCHAIRHAIGGTSAQASLAPDLTHLMSRHTLAAGVLPNTAEDLARWLKNPQTVKPGTLMPDLKLTDAQVEQLVAYLETLR